jgi:hypothetical protein
MQIPLPGGWVDLADIKNPATLQPSQQDDYQDLRLEIIDAKEKAAIAVAAAAYPGAVPDPDAPPPSVRLLRRDLKPVHDLVCQWIVQGISFPGILPWDAGSRNRLATAGGLVVWNALLKALDPYFEILNGNVPKETQPSAPTSGSTSSASAAAPPEASAPAPSATPAG